MKKLTAVLAVLLALAVFAPSFCFAQDENGQRVYDDAALFTQDQAALLQEEILQFRADYDLDLAVVTTSDAKGKTAKEYADDYYDDNGFGVGEDYSGALFLIDMDNREAYISTCGSAIDLLTDARIDAVLDDAYEGLSGQDYFASAQAFLAGVTEYAEKARQEALKNQRVFDAAGIFTASEANKLQQECADLKKKTGLDFTIVSDKQQVVDSGYSTKFLQEHDLGYSGFILLMYLSDDPQYELNGYGTGMEAFSEDRLHEIMQSATDKMTEDGYYAGALEYLDDMRKYCAELSVGTSSSSTSSQAAKPPAVSSKPYDSVPSKPQRSSRLSAGFIVLFAVISAVAGTVCCFIVKRKYSLDSPAYQYPFRKKAQMNLTCREDTFLHETVTQRYIPPPDDHSSGGDSSFGGGSSFSGHSSGSSTHVSSSGQTHGGGGRKF